MIYATQTHGMLFHLKVYSFVLCVYYLWRHIENLMITISKITLCMMITHTCVKNIHRISEFCVCKIRDNDYNLQASGLKSKDRSTFWKFKNIIMVPNTWNLKFIIILVHRCTYFERVLCRERIKWRYIGEAYRFG